MSLIFGEYNSTPPTLSNGSNGAIQLDSASNLRTTASIASGSTVGLLGAAKGSTAATQVTVLPTGSNANAMHVINVASDGTVLNGYTDQNSDTIGGSGNKQDIVAKVVLYNGTNWSRGRDIVGASSNVGLMAVANAPSTSANQACSIYRNTALKNTAQSVKGSVGNLFGMTIQNLDASINYIKFYNSASPTVGSTTPVLTLAIAASSSLTIAPTAIAMANFATAISVAVTTGVGDADNTAPTNGVLAQIFYK